MKKLFFALFFSLFILIQNSIIGYSQNQDQADFILQIRNYGQNTLLLKIDSTFYSKFDDSPAEYHYYVYVSKSQFPENPDSLKYAFIYCEKDSKKADSVSLHWKNQDFHTLIYKTAGTSAAQLNHILLSYPSEDFSFILLHEAIHVHLKTAKIKIPYEFEESLGDFVGNWGTLFGQLTSFKKAQKMILLNEKIYRFNVNAERELKAKGFSENLYKKNQKELKKILRNADVFRRDRFNYEPNNAYFLRNKYYGEKYFFWKYMLIERFLN